MNQILLVSGYRGTGKDTFFKIISGQEDNFKWSIPDELNCIIESYKTIKRFAFADKLKQKLGITDEMKNKILLGNKTGRDILIEFAKEKRNEDPLYFCKLLIDDLLQLENTLVIITDHRYPNEYEYILTKFDNVKTIRLYRKSVPVPDESIESERSLDNFNFDFFLESN